MTNQQINEAISELFGWRKEDGVWMWTADGIDYTSPELWDWCNDLNMMHQVDKVFGTPDVYDYEANLQEVCGGFEYYWHATARQRAEAFLRTLGKWNHIGDSTELVKEAE